MTTGHRLLLACALAFAAIAGCCAAPPPGAAVPASTGAPGAAVPPSTAAPGAEAGAKQAGAGAAAERDPCIVARMEGTVGNCIAPSLVIQDTCEDRRYDLHFDDCYEARGIDLSGLAMTNTKLVGAYVCDGHPTPPVPPDNRHAVTAIRGSIVGGERQLGGATFDIDIDYVRQGVKQTKHLKGATQPRFVATNQ